MSGRLENNRIWGLLLKYLKQSAGKQLAGKTLNSETLRNSLGRVRVAKKKFGSGRVAGTRQALPRMESSGQDSVWTGTFWSFLNTSLHASSAQLGIGYWRAITYFSSLTYGSQLTYRTQLEKVIIFRYTFSSLTGGPNWPPRHSLRKWSFFVTNGGIQPTFQMFRLS